MRLLLVALALAATSPAARFRGYFCLSTQSTRVFRSASERPEFGGIGTTPQAPRPPLRIKANLRAFEARVRGGRVRRSSASTGTSS